MPKNPAFPTAAEFTVSLSQTQLGPQKWLNPSVIMTLPIKHIEPVLDDGSPVIHSDQRLVITH